MVSTKTMQPRLPHLFRALDHPAQIAMRIPLPNTSHLRSTGPQEMLWHMSWVTTYLQRFPGHHSLSATEKSLFQLVEWSQQPTNQECPRQCSTSYVCVCGGGGDRDPEHHQSSVHTWIPLDQCGPILGPLGEPSTQKRWCPPVGYTCAGLHTGIIIPAVLPALT